MNHFGTERTSSQNIRTNDFRGAVVLFYSKNGLRKPFVLEIGKVAKKSQLANGSFSLFQNHLS